MFSENGGLLKSGTDTLIFSEVSFRVPLYEYQCKKCQHKFEKIQKFSDQPIRKCPECGGQLEKVMHAPAVQFKGSGWYVTDYGGKSDKGEKSKPEGDPEKASSEKKESTGKEDGAKAKDAKDKDSSSKKPEPKKSENKKSRD
jgi:putative FmdB family regulatory protein